MLNQRAVLGLLNTKGIGRTRAREVARVGRDEIVSAADLLDTIRSDAGLIPDRAVPTVSEIEAGLQSADRIIDDAWKKGVAIVLNGEADFPEALSGIPDAPLLLYVKGSVDGLREMPAAAIVGTRDPTSWGEQASGRIAERMASAGFVVVSGLARGCDTAAHRGCLRAGGTTVAVLAHGLDTVYPAENRRLAEMIVEEGGCLLSEYAPGERGRKRYFVERDRLQSGLSRCVVVIETGERGGTMHTVKACKEQGRILACVQHPERLSKDPRAAGNRILIEREGALRIAGSDDLAKLIRKAGLGSVADRGAGDSRRESGQMDLFEEREREG